MRYLTSENPYLICRFSTGDAATIDIYDLSDDSKIVDGASMSEIGSTGYFKYQFNPSPATLTEYLYIADNGTEEHAGKVILGGYPDSILEDTNELQSNQGNWVTATGFSTHSAADVRAEMDNNSTKLLAIETDTQDIQSRIPAALSPDGNIKADALAISGSTDAADKLEASAKTIVPGTAVAGTLSNTQMTTDLTETTNNHYNGRIIIWTSGALKDQATDVTSYDGTTKKLTYTATTEAPSEGDTFVLV